MKEGSGQSPPTTGTGSARAAPASARQALRERSLGKPRTREAPPCTRPPADREGKPRRLLYRTARLASERPPAAAVRADVEAHPAPARGHPDVKEPRRG